MKKQIGQLQKIKKLSALIRTEKATIRANKAKQAMQNLSMQNGQGKGFRTKARTKRLIELGALFDICRFGSSRSCNIGWYVE